MKRYMQYMIIVCALVTGGHAMMFFVTGERASQHNSASKTSFLTDSTSSDCVYILKSLDESPGSELHNSSQVQIGFARTLPFSSDLKLLRHSRFIQQKFISAFRVFHKHHSLLQRDGFYLFTLCKILI